MGTFFLFLIQASHFPKWTGFNLGNIFVGALRGAKSKSFNRISIVAGPVIFPVLYH